ncbi:penicillin-binding protein 1C [Geofilum sp. OHC36d9]|uniref:penicillin-binding protein 1C n=1 Tax=Geofilum sp. OHC36d9 TaxID=3458413 RepID=UPI004033664B
MISFKPILLSISRKTFGKALHNNHLKWGILLIAGWLFFWYSIPRPLFKTSYSTVVTDRSGQLLGAHIADDGQWRFPPADSVPAKFITALLTFEDAYFYKHPGVNPISLLRALSQNIKQGKIVSGGSTITMQVIRLAQPSKRTVFTKTIEIIKALRLELTNSKDAILKLYAAHAPFGGNTVGLEAASWRYFNHPAQELTWSETALLAVLPNAPGLMHPGKNRTLLIKKRNRLLQKLYTKGYLDSLTCQLALLEPLPEKPQALPQLTPHLLDFYLKNKKGKNIRTSIDRHLQINAARIVNQHSHRLSQNEIYNAAALIANVETGEIIAYIGNSDPTEPYKGNQVDIIRAPRSSGSVLKPILYAAALQEGLIMPTTLLPDIPTYYKNFVPRNYQAFYDGAVPADEALSRSLNIPFVRLLDRFGGEIFLKTLKRCGFTTFNQPYSHYGLSLILGGGEITLLELAGCYASMSRTLNYYVANDGTYSDHLTRSLSCEPTTHTPSTKNNISYTPVLRAGTIYQTFKAMTNLQRPPEESGWKYFGTSRQIAWKTGTSFGFRDAWAVGVTPQYVIAVWAGNASGEGRPGIVGGTAAGPMLFELFNLLPPTPKFATPYDDLAETTICRLSGYRAGPYCSETDTLLVPRQTRENKPCPYHHIEHVTKDERYRTRIGCESANNIKAVNYFTLPPVMEWYYQRRHPEYKTLPPLKPGCFDSSEEQPMEFVYPPANTTIALPIGLDGSLQKVILKAIHRNPDAVIFWHLDGNFLGSTQSPHDMEIQPDKGRHIITLIDNTGIRTTRIFYCLPRSDKATNL